MKIAIIGAGGIGSYLVRALSDLMDKQQLRNVDITVFDDDQVEESNIMYQDFSIDDILDNKAEALATRYRITAVDAKIEKISELKDFDLVVSCVDNSIVRRMIFKNYEKIKDFIDLRSEGKSYAIYTKDGNTKDKLLKTLPEKDVENGSCQLAVDKKSGNIQQGNKIVALIGSQAILDRARGSKTKLSIVQSL